MENKWYDLDEQQQVKEIYSKHTIKSFWKWWSNGEDKAMEIRIKDSAVVKQTANKYKLPWCSGGVIVYNYIQLKNVIAFVREKATVWFGVNPRKKNYNYKGWNVWGCGRKGGCSDHNVDEIGFMFIDIDRITKDGVASRLDLKHSDEVANKILECLSNEAWNKGYAKIGSGHGLQLLIKLDFPIKMPTCDFDNETKAFFPNTEFEKMKKIIPMGIGKEILKFTNKLKKEYGVELDSSCFTLSRVGALPVTKNFKYETSRWRGIIELEDKDNVGLSDYILSKEEDIEVFKQRNVFKISSSLTRKTRLRKGKLLDNELVQFILNNNFPEGGINNTLWFQLKILLRDSNYDLQSKEFVKFHSMICQKHKRDFTLNFPEDKFKFSENVVNNYAVQNGIIPPYKLWPNRHKHLAMKLENLSWGNMELEDDIMELKSDTTILDDMEQCKNKLIEGDYNNICKVAQFMKGCVKKYGEEQTKFYFDNVFERFLCWK